MIPPIFMVESNAASSVSVTRLCTVMETSIAAGPGARAVMALQLKSHMSGPALMHVKLGHF